MTSAAATAVIPLPVKTRITAMLDDDVIEAVQCELRMAKISLSPATDCRSLLETAVDTVGRLLNSLRLPPNGVNQSRVMLGIECMRISSSMDQKCPIGPGACTR